MRSLAMKFLKALFSVLFSLTLVSSAWASVDGAEGQVININSALGYLEEAWHQVRVKESLSPAESEQKVIESISDHLSEILRITYKINDVKPSLRVVDASQLEQLEAKGVPKSVIKYFTFDHHKSFGEGLATGVNSTTQILDLLESATVKQSEFNQMFRFFASDNIGDAYGLALAVVRNADKIRGNAKMIAQLRQLAKNEDFGIFGPNVNFDNEDTLAALLRLNDATLKLIGDERTFMDRIQLGFSQKTIDSINRMQVQYKQILFPSGLADRKQIHLLANEFREQIKKGVRLARVQRIRVEFGKNGVAPIYLANTTLIDRESEGRQFEAWVFVPQFLRELRDRENFVVERNFTISGDSASATRTLILANVDGVRAKSMFVVPANKEHSFFDSYLEAEKKAIKLRLETTGYFHDQKSREDAEARLAGIEEGEWKPQYRPDGSLIFTPTYMQSEELETLVKNSLDLL